MPATYTLWQNSNADYLHASVRGIGNFKITLATTYSSTLKCVFPHIGNFKMYIILKKRILCTIASKYTENINIGGCQEAFK